MVRKITITQRRSTIGVKPRLRRTLRALGLRGIGTSNDLPDNDATRGMMASVSHLIDHEPAEGR